MARKIATSVAKRKLVNRTTGDDYGSISLSIGAVLFNRVEYMPQSMCGGLDFTGAGRYDPALWCGPVV